MLRIFHNTNYDFIKPWRIALGITLAFYIAGAAVYPTAGSANPTLTLVALSLRLSDHLKTKLV